MFPPHHLRGGIEFDIIWDRAVVNGSRYFTDIEKAKLNNAYSEGYKYFILGVSMPSSDESYHLDYYWFSTTVTMNCYDYIHYGSKIFYIPNTGNPQDMIRDRNYYQTHNIYEKVTIYRVKI